MLLARVPTTYLVMVQGIERQCMALRRIDAQSSQQFKHLLLDHHIGGVQGCGGSETSQEAHGPVSPNSL